MSNNYTILHLHTHYSNGVTNVDSVTHPEQYIEKAKKLGMMAMAFSEHGNIFHWLNKKQAIEKAGMKYIHAEEFYVTETIEEKTRDNYHCLLIAKNYDGVLELNKLSSISFNRKDGHYYYVPRITLDELMATSDNILVSTACLGGILHKGTVEIIDKFITWLIEHKDRCYLEIQPHLDNDQILYNKYLFMQSEHYGIPLLMCTDTHALNDLHVKARALLQKAKDIHFDGEDKFHLEMLSYDELISLCEQQDAIPMSAYINAIEETNRLADRIETFKIDFSYKYPHLWGDNSELIFRQKIEQGLIDRGIIGKSNEQEYRDRIEHEMKAYIHNGAIDFMLLMEDICGWCKDQGIGIGYGRGSCNGSIIAYLLHITEMDSIKFNLNFDRFMNVERVSLSDIDTDIPPSRINDVKQYVFNKHGLYCADIITFNTNALRGAVIDVCRGVFKDKTDVDYRARANEIIELAENDEEKARDKYNDYFKFIDLLNGCIMSIGNHASALIVAPHSIADRLGLATTATDDVPISQINMKEVDNLNYVKLDLLKLDTIEIINQTCQYAGIERLTPDNIDINDKAVWDSMRENSVAIFQMESNSAQDYMRRLFSDSVVKKIHDRNPYITFVDLFAMANGAIRPAGASYRDKLANGEFNELGHEALNKHFSSTNGFMVFQCQIISFLHEFCGYTMGQADVVRRHFSKKTGTEEDIPKIKAGFIKTMKEQYGVDESESENLIVQLLQVIQDASDYLFSLNHSLPYSYEGYACGWLRYYYPLEFLTVALNVNVGKPDSETKETKLLNYAKSNGIKIESPKFRYGRSGYFFDKDSNTIFKGIGSIKGMGKTVGDELYAMRHRNFKNWIELLYAIKNETSVDKSDLDILIHINFFNEFGNINALRYTADVFDKFWKCKTIKVDKLNELGIDNIGDTWYNKRTKKTIGDIDNYSLIMTKIKSDKKNSKIPRTKPIDIISGQLKHLGYTSYSDSNRDANDWLIVSTNTTKYGTTYATAYNICYGATREYRLNRKYYNSHGCNQGDIIKAIIWEVPKRKQIDGKWIELPEKISEIKCWKTLDK